MTGTREDKNIVAVETSIETSHHQAGSMILRTSTLPIDLRTSTTEEEIIIKEVPTLLEETGNTKIITGRTKVVIRRTKVAIRRTKVVTERQKYMVYFPEVGLDN